MNFIHSIKFRFTLWYLLVLAITLIFLCAGVYVVLFNTLYSSLDDALVIMIEDPDWAREMVDAFTELVVAYLGELVKAGFHIDGILAYGEIAFIHPKGSHGVLIELVQRD
jgi:hypothetical protein